MSPHPRSDDPSPHPVPHILAVASESPLYLAGAGVLGSQSRHGEIEVATELTAAQRTALSRLKGFTDPVSAGKITGVPPAERPTVLQELARRGLVQVLRPSGGQRTARFVLTPHGREVAIRIEPARPTRLTLKWLADRTEKLTARLSHVEGRLAKLEGNKGKGLPEGAPSEQVREAAEPGYEEFRETAYAVYTRADQTGRTLGLVPIPDLRQAMGGYVSRQAFDRNLLRLHQDGVVQLMPHDHPASLPEDRRREGVEHPTAGLLYFVRWLKP